MRADAGLRANVRLLGDLLGRVLVEQEGQEVLDLVERIRSLSRWARRTGEREPLEETISALPLERQAVVLRAFGVFFQLANIAEQHHRSGAARAYEHEGRVPRESPEDAFARPDAAGWGGGIRTRGRGGTRRARLYPPTRRKRLGAPSCRRTSGSQRSYASWTTRSRRPRAWRGSRTRWPRRSPSSGRPTRCDRDDPGSTTRSDTGSALRAQLWQAAPALVAGIPAALCRTHRHRSASAPGSAVT